MLDAMMDLGRRQVTMCESVDVLAKEATDVYRDLFFFSLSLYHHGTASTRRRRRSPSAATAVNLLSIRLRNDSYLGHLVSDPIPPVDDIRT